MADYQLTDTDIVIRARDRASIPNAATNVDRIAYEQWLADGGVPDPSPSAISDQWDWGLRFVEVIGG